MAPLYWVTFLTKNEGFPNIPYRNLLKQAYFSLMDSKWDFPKISIMKESLWKHLKDCMLLFYLFFKTGNLRYINLTLVSIHSLASRHSVPNYKLSCSLQWVGWLAFTQYTEANPSRIDSSGQKHALIGRASDCVNDFLKGQGH